MEIVNNIELTKIVEDGIHSVFTSEQYKNYLKQVLLFRNYSPINTLLIFLQNPNATQVASYNSWLELNRQVKKCEKGIAIYTPYKVEKNSFQEDKINGRLVQEIKFKSTCVFDVNQTYGEPIQNACNLSKDIKSFENIFLAIKKACSYPIVIKKLDEKSSGYFSPKEKEIVLKFGMSDEQIIKTLIHEFAYAMLNINIKSCSDNLKLKANSIAYLLSDFIGVDTSTFSFDCVENFTKMQINELQQMLESIQQTANLIINKLDFSLEEIQKSSIENKKTLMQKLSKAKANLAENYLPKENLIYEK